ncbi:hypothetical protein GQ600_6931 [Phytophthora cactorum]|nr:hypothetical protein GQ600_6931 [Phytophthora cactorum]
MHSNILLLLGLCVAASILHATDGRTTQEWPRIASLARTRTTDVITTSTTTRSTTVTTRTTRTTVVDALQYPLVVGVVRRCLHPARD